MSHWLNIEVQFHFGDLTSEVTDGAAELRKICEQRGPDAFDSCLVADREAGGFTLDFSFHGDVSCLAAQEIIDAVQALGSLGDRGVMVDERYDDEKYRYAVGSNEEAIQQCQLRDAAERSAALLVEAMPESAARNSLGERVDKQTIARALQALFTDKPWSIVTCCHEDVEMRSQSFLVEGTWAQARDLVDAYVNAVEAGEIAPGQDLPDPDFQVVEGYDAYGTLLQLANCLDEPDLSRHDLEEKRQRKRAESGAGE